MRAIAIATLGMLLLATPALAGRKPQPPVTLFGTTQCPPGYTESYAGSVVYLNAYSPGATADGRCWMAANVPKSLPPDPETGYAPAFTVVGPCVVCVK